MKSRRPIVTAMLCALSLGALACDEGPTKAPPPANPSEPAAASAKAETPEPPAPKPEPEPAPEPEPPAGPSCDRRGSDATGPAASTCVDYGQHRGALEPRCPEGLSLAEVGCPTEAAVASCSLPATGVRFFYYEGVDLAAATRECEILDGDFFAGPPE